MPPLAARFIISLLLVTSTQANAQAGASPPLEKQQIAQELGSGEPKPASAVGEICRMLEQAALENALPIDFFVRIIWQESRFNAGAVSPKGAQGIAQFMPRTALWRGLTDPFDLLEAVKAAAGYLRDLQNRFGNLGLAAAAYNAGPQRIQNWLAGRGALPNETRSYVHIVTGHSAEEWSAGAHQANLMLPDPMPCRDIAKSISDWAPARSANGLEKVPKNINTEHKPGWGVQLVGSSSQTAALAGFQQLQKAYRKQLGFRQPFVIQSRVGTSGFWYRVRVATETRTEADQLCLALRAAGATCLVQRN